MSFSNVESIMVLLMELFMQNRENENQSDPIPDEACSDEEIACEYIFEEYFDDCISRTLSFDQDSYEDSFSDLMLPIRDAITSGRTRYPAGTA